MVQHIENLVIEKSQELLYGRGFHDDSCLTNHNSGVQLNDLADTNSMTSSNRFHLAGNGGLPEGPAAYSKTRSGH